MERFIHDANRFGEHTQPAQRASLLVVLFPPRVAAGALAGRFFSVPWELHGSSPGGDGAFGGDFGD